MLSIRHKLDTWIRRVRAETDTLPIITHAGLPTRQWALASIIHVGKTASTVTTAHCFLAGISGSRAGLRVALAHALHALVAHCALVAVITVCAVAGAMRLAFAGLGVALCDAVTGRGSWKVGRVWGCNCHGCIHPCCKACDLNTKQQQQKHHRV